MDPRTRLEHNRLSVWQIVALALTIGLNALDGFDVLSISYASPLIAAEWGIDRAMLGAVLSMELIGMAMGSMLLGGLADALGRRPTILGCLIVMCAGMFGASSAHGVAALSLWRLLTGFGIGGILAAINAVAAETANARQRGLAMSLMVIGYPLGAVFGGMAVAPLIAGGDWRAIFQFGAVVTACFIPLVWFLLPETIAFLCHKQPANGLKTLNATLHRFAQPPVANWPPPDPEAPPRRMGDLFRPAMIATTLLLTLAFFAHASAFYFILKWIPKIVVDMGFAPAAAGAVLIWANVGGALGGAVFGLISLRVAIRPLLIFTFLASFAMLTAFGAGQSTLHDLAMMAAITGFFTNAGIVGLYALLGGAFPTHVRASGTGFAIGVGRGGAAFAPWFGGLLFAHGFGLQMVAIVMATGSLLAAAAIAALKR